MKYTECTAAYRIAIIQEIIEYARHEDTACYLIRAFMDNEMTTTEIEDFLF